jgi:glucan endo-1,3-beta-D-glucosidase
MRPSTVLALAASVSAASASALQGFNYGSTKSDGTFQMQSDYEALFAAAKKVTTGFSSARLYTMIQGGSSTNETTQAIPAAIAQDTTLLLGIWASAGNGQIEAELIALQSAIQLYGSKFTDLVVGISVGSEDLYRNSPTGIAAKDGIGANPADLVNYIKEVRAAIANTGLSKVPIGHVDTWTSWTNSSNSQVAAACDWVGMDAYPYFQNSMANSISAAAGLFNDALSATQAAVGGKEVWVTETGWPVSGSTQNQAVPSIANAKTYWDAVGCPNFGKINMFWFTLQDAAPVTPNPSFGIVGSKLSDTPLYDLSCKDVSALPSTTAPTASGTAAANTATGATGSTPTGSGTTFSATSTPSIPSSNSISNTSPTSPLSSPPYASGSSSGSSGSSGTTSGSLSGPGPARSSSSSYGVPGSPANSTIGSSTGAAKGGSSSSSTGSAAAPTTSTAAASARLVSGPAVGVLAAAAAVVAML